MWCPKCENEYRPGITVCPDCGVPLVEELPQEGAASERGAQKKQTDAPTTETAVHRPSADAPLSSSNTGASMSGTDMPDAKTDAVMSGFDAFDAETDALMSGESASAAEAAAPQPSPYVYDDTEEIIPGQPEIGRERTAIYQSSAEKAEENRSAASALLVVGSIGLAAVVLLFFDVFPFIRLNNKYMVCGVMGVLFLLFIVMGVVSMRSFKTLKTKAGSEQNLREEIRRWCGENVTAQAIDEAVLAAHGELSPDDPDYEEVMYFYRTQEIRRLVGAQFLNLESGFAERFADEYYDELYGSGKRTDSAEQASEDETDA